METKLFEKVKDFAKIFGVSAMDIANPTAITATDTGATTGTIPAGTKAVDIDADSDANHIVILPAPVVGHIIFGKVDGTGCELRSSAPATIGINGGTGASAEMALAANVPFVAICVSTTNWVVIKFTALEAAA